MFNQWHVLVLNYLNVLLFNSLHVLFLNNCKCLRKETEIQEKNQLTKFHLASAGQMHEPFRVRKAYKLFEEALDCGTTLSAPNTWQPYVILEFHLQNENINLRK